MRNIEILKQAHQQRLHFRSFADWEIKGFGYRELEESRVETLHHRSPEVTKCETLKFQNRHINKEFHRLENNSI